MFLPSLEIKNLQNGPVLNTESLEADAEPQNMIINLFISYLFNCFLQASILIFNLQTECHHQFTTTK